MKVTSKMRLDIQAMRGIAVLAVILFHANEDLFKFGYLGVDIFFVISGFVVTPSIYRIIQSDQSARDILSKLFRFYKRRFLRLAPALGFSLTLSSFILFLFGNMQDHLRIASQGIATLLLVGNIGAAKYSGNYFFPNPNPFIHTWSLSVEEQIYLFLPLSLIFLGYAFGFARKKQIIFLALISSFSGFVFFVPQILGTFHSAIGLDNIFNAVFYSPISRVWEFGLGGLSALILSTSIEKTFFTRTVARVVLTLLLLLVLVPKIHTSFYTGCVAITILSSLSISAKAFEILPKNIAAVLVWLGDRSYSMYLFHMPLIYIAKYSPIVVIRENSLASLTLALISTLILGHLSYAIVENKYRLRGSHETKRKSSLRSAFMISAVFPLSLLIFIQYEVQKNYSNILPKQSQYESEDTHQAFVRGCIDLKFDRKQCIWPAQKSKGEILVIGDSQAYAVADGVIIAGNRLNYDVVVSSVSGCPFIGLDTTGTKSVNCLNWQSEILKYIKETKPNFVFIANRTNGYLNPDSGWRVFVDLEGRQVRERSLALESYKEALITTLTKITRSSNAVLIQNIPEPGFIDSNTLVSKLFDREASRSASLNRFSTDTPVNLLEQGISESISRTFVLNSTLTLCPLDRCILRESGKNIYRDSWHLSTFGSQKLAGKISQILIMNSKS